MVKATPKAILLLPLAAATVDLLAMYPSQTHVAEAAMEALEETVRRSTEGKIGGKGQGESWEICYKELQVL